MVNSEYHKTSIWVSPDQKSGKELLLAKLLHLTQDKWNKYLTDTDVSDQENKNLKPSQHSTLRTTHSSKHAWLRSESDKENEELRAICSSTPIATKIKPEKITVVERKPPFVSGILLKPTVNKVEDKLIYGCEKCRAVRGKNSCRSNKSFSGFCVKDKINYFEDAQKRKQENRFMVNFYDSTNGKELLDEYKEEEIDETCDESSTTETVVETCDESSTTNETVVESIDEPDSVNDATLVEAEEASVQLSSPPTSTAPILDETLNKTVDYDTLMEAINVQCITMAQASKALKICRSKTQPRACELIEAERALLISGKKRELLVKKLRKSLLEENASLETSSANIELSHLRFSLKPSVERYKFKSWYVALFFTDSVLYATDWVEIDPNRNFIYFLESFTFEKVPPTFGVDIYLFEVRLPRKKSSKGTITCLQRKNRLMRRLCQVLTYKDVYTGKNERVRIPLTSFTLCGQLRITKDSLHGIQTHHLSQTSKNSVLDGNAYLLTDIRNLKMNQDFQGFLTVGTELMGRIVWDRKWCHLQNCVLRFWEYPSQQELRKPKLRINLKHSLDDEIEIGGQGMCSRSRTMIIRVEPNQRPDESLSLSLCNLVYHVTADTVQEMEAWRSRLNAVLHSLKLWK